MINLNNTWCEATEENVDKLLKRKVSFWELGCISNYIGKYKYVNIYSKDNRYEAKFRKKDISGSEIHLVNGEFQYVEIKPKNNFKDYGFEADFEGEILKEYENQFVGMVYQNEGNFGCSWNKKGKCLQTKGFGYIDMNLKPIKKEWYENPDNFPCLCIDYFDNPIVVFSKEEYDKCPRLRLATKEEVLALLVKE